MKATVDIPDDLYRRVKAKSALEGRPVRDVTVALFRQWLEAGAERPAEKSDESSDRPPAWFGALRRHAAKARGRHDMDSIRKSIARGRVSLGDRR